MSMRSNLLVDFTNRLLVGYLFDIFVFVVLYKTSTPVWCTLAVAILIALTYTVYTVFEVFVKPIQRLANRLTNSDLNIGICEYNGNNEIGILYSKFKELSRVFDLEVYKSEHDTLSGLYNRTRLEKMHDDYYNSNELCVVYIDVNNLKKMNDNFGHEAGDVLIQTSARKLNFWRGIGDTYRLGGDEFLVVIQNRSCIECSNLIESWYSTVGCLNRDTDGFKCLMAYGVSYGGYHSDIDDLIKRADKLMYAHKAKLKEEIE